MNDWETQPEIKIQQNINYMTDTKCIFMPTYWIIGSIVLDLCVCMYVWNIAYNSWTVQGTLFRIVMHIP